MNVVIGSMNPPKAEAVKKAFATMFPDETIAYVQVAAQSGVSDHPITAEESIAGAKNRIAHARELELGADYYVGIEGGLLTVGDDAWELGWVAIANAGGTVNIGMSAGLQIQGKLLSAIQSGTEMSVALDKFYGLKDLGKKNGFYGLVTDNAITRASGYVDAVMFALAPFKHPQYFE